MDIKGFKTKDGVVHKYDHEALANIPKIPSQEGYAKESWVQKNYQPKGDYLESTKLTEAVNTALTQAKESGEFDGKDGYTPVKGKDYFDGEPGQPGAPGKTPVKGTDYYTEADKAEMVNSVLAALPTWTGGSY